jgi:hypothetical protein
MKDPGNPRSWLVCLRLERSRHCGRRHRHGYYLFLLPSPLLLRDGETRFLLNEHVAACGPFLLTPAGRAPSALIQRDRRHVSLRCVSVSIKPRSSRPLGGRVLDILKALPNPLDALNPSTAGPADH